MMNLKSNKIYSMDFHKIIEEFTVWAEKTDIIFLEAEIHKAYLATIFIYDETEDCSIFKSIALKKEIKTIFFDRNILDEETLSTLSDKIKFIKDEELNKSLRSLSEFVDQTIKF